MYYLHLANVCQVLLQTRAATARPSAAILNPAMKFHPADTVDGNKV